MLAHRVRYINHSHKKYQTIDNPQHGLYNPRCGRYVRRYLCCTQRERVVLAYDRVRVF
jgi:hypothetical protein